MLDKPMYFSGQGRILAAIRDTNGKPGAYTLIGDCSSAKMEPKIETEDIKESMSGYRLLAKRSITGQTMDFTATCKQFSKLSCALGFYSDPVAIVAGSATAETLPSGLVAGDEIGLAHGNVSDLVITDSTATPKTLVKDTDYVENNLVFGNVGILRDAATGTYTEPLTAAYSYTGADAFPMFTKTPEERFIRIEGLNTVEDMAPVLIEIFKAQAAPFSGVDWISDTASNQDIAFACLYDAINGSDPNMGPFGRVTFL